MFILRNTALCLFSCLLLCVDDLHGQKIAVPGSGGAVEVELGVTKAAFLQKHPKAITLPGEMAGVGGGAPSGVESYAEIEMDAEGRSALWYYFKGDVLRGVSISRAYFPGQEKILAKYLNEVYGGVARTMTWVADEQTLRSDGLEGFVVTAEHWKSKTDGTELYFIATNKEVTTVQYDPQHLSRADFLMDPAMKAKIDENGARLRAKLSPEMLEKDKKKMGSGGITDAPRPFKPGK